MQIKIYGDPFLRKKAKPAEKIGPKQKKIFEEMARVMYAAKGAGLASTQVGIEEQLLVIDVGSGLLKLANPVLVKTEGIEYGEEGCLSIPEVSVRIKRSRKVTVEALNQDGIKVKIEADGLLARVLQHEIDHLKGILIIDRAGLRQMFLAAWKLRKMKIQKSILRRTLFAQD